MAELRTWAQIMSQIKRLVGSNDARQWAFGRCVCEVDALPVDSDGDPWCRADDMTAAWIDKETLRKAITMFQGPLGREFEREFKGEADA